MLNAGFASETLETAIAQLRENTDLDDASICQLFESAFVDAYYKTSADTAPVRAVVDLARAQCELWRRNEDGEEEPAALERTFPREAARSARQALTRALADTERTRVLQAAATHRFGLVDGIVERKTGKVWQLRIGELEGVLPPEEQIPGEQLQLHQHLKVIVLEARERDKHPVLSVSRSHPQLLRLLLEREVPELQSGEVVIRGIAREAGRRAKVAVASPSGAVDPQGACIGPKGVRHRAVTSELGGEQLQIVLWDADPQRYVANALIPAHVKGVTIDDAAGTAHVQVDPDQLSLAIGKSGENARLTARLVGLRIDIRAEPIAEPS